MSVKIRLRRMGNNNKPFFRVTVADSRSPAKGRFLENIGWYDPEGQKGQNFNIDKDRLDYWKDQGAEVSDTIRNLVKMMKNPPKVQPAPAPKKSEPAPAPADEAKAEEAEAPAEEPAAEPAVEEAASEEAAPAEEAAEETPAKAEEEEPAKKDA